MIKRIELINFMSHRHTVIEPADGLTVLIGPNNCGKSAFVTALQILCHNSKSGFVLRHGEKKCEVIVETTDGHVINWSRKKNGSGIYVIDGEPFDRLRGSVPAKVHEILKMPKVQCDKEEFDVHFGEQSEPVFLLRDRGKASAQFFASSSDATHLVAMQSLHKSKVLVNKRDFKQLTRQQESLTEQLESLKPVDKLEETLAAAEKQHLELQAAATKLEQIKQLMSAITTSQSNYDRYSKQATPLQKLIAPPEIKDERPLRELVASMKIAQTNLDRHSKQATQLQSLATPPEIKDERPLRELIASIESTAARGVVSQSMSAAFGKLSPSPAIKPAEPLEGLLQQIKSKQATGGQATKLATAFESLSPAPEIADTKALQRLLQKLQDRQRTSEISERLLATVSNAPPLPKQTDIVAFSQTLDSIGTKQRQVTQKADLCKQANEELVALQIEFEVWVDANPVCPTCGSETDAQHLLEHQDHAGLKSSGESRG